MARNPNPNLNPTRINLLTAQSPRAPQPNGRTLDLMPHQLAMLHKCTLIEELDAHVGVLNDKPGAGKTFVMLSLLLNDPREGVTILVIPPNIYTQWQQELKRFSPSLRFMTMITYAETSELYYIQDFSNIDIIITTPMYFNVLNDALAATETTVKRVILDEADTAMVALATNSFQSKMVWLVSASLKLDIMLDYRLQQFGIDRTRTHEFVCKCDEAFVREGFIIPEPVTQTISCSTEYVDRILRHFLNHFELASMNAYDFTGLRTKYVTLVANNEKEALEYLIQDVLKTIDANEADLADLERRKHENPAVIAVTIARLQNELDVAKHKRDLIADRVKTTDMCIICLDDFNAEKLRAITPCCQNVLCKPCLTNWYDKQTANPSRCAYCRSHAEVSKHVIIESKEEQTSEPEPAQDTNENEVETTKGMWTSQLNKLDTLKQLFTDGQLGSKIIIFSDYSHTFQHLKRIMDDLQVRFVELDGGNIPAIDRTVSAFKDPNSGIRVLMSNSSFYGCGMNLENTTDVVFMHRVQAKMQNQVLGRAQRPGRTGPLKVYNLYHANEQL